jgi:hypothetical protein
MYLGFGLVVVHLLHIRNEFHYVVSWIDRCSRPNDYRARPYAAAERKLKRMEDPANLSRAAFAQLALRLSS